MTDRDDFQDLENRLSGLSPASAPDRFQEQLKSIALVNTVITDSKNFPQKRIRFWTSAAALAAMILVGLLVISQNSRNSNPETGRLPVSAGKDQKSFSFDSLETGPTILSFRLQQKQGKELPEILQAQTAILLPDYPLDLSDLYRIQ